MTAFDAYVIPVIKRRKTAMQETDNEADSSNIYDSSICQMSVLDLEFIKRDQETLIILVSLALSQNIIFLSLFLFLFFSQLVSDTVTGYTHLDSDLVSIMGLGSMNLCKRSASERHWIELGKQLKKETRIYVHCEGGKNMR